jgi:phosphoglycerate dehydrogenase-like enzyme
MRVVGIRRTSGAASGRVASGAAWHGAEVRPSGELRDAFAMSDAVVVCLPKTPTTLGLVDRAALLALRPRALVVNLGRGGIVDEAALLEALQSGHLGGAALDVFEREPLAPESPWWSAPNTIVTPHVAGFGLCYVERTLDVFFENLRRLERGEPLLHEVDPRVGY